MYRYRVTIFFAVALFIVMPPLPPAASESMQNTQPPILSTTVPNEQTPAVVVTAVGTIKKQGFTSYMYGTHVLADSDGKTLYALKSESIDLDLYVGGKVTIRAHLSTDILSITVLRILT